MSVHKIMPTPTLIKFALIIFSFSATSFAEGPYAPPCTPPSLAGPELARALTEEYQSQAISCTNGKLSAVWCSGVLVKPGTPGRPSWTQSPSEILMKSGGVYYLRNKQKTGNFTWGALISPVTSGKEVRPACVYPHSISTEQPRNDAGCGMESPHPTISPVSDLNSCETYGVYDEATYRKKNKDCSFSTQLKKEFQAALEINERGGENKPVQVWLSPWPAEPTAQGFVYIKNSHEGLINARRDAQEYANLTGKNVPVILFDPAPPGTFTYVPGETISADISAEAVKHLNDDLSDRKSIMLTYVPPERVTEEVYEPEDDRINIAHLQSIAVPDTFKPLSSLRATYGIATTRSGARAIYHTNGFVKIGGASKKLADKLQKKLYLTSQSLLPVVSLDIGSTDELSRKLNEGVDTLFVAEKQQSVASTPDERIVSAIQKRYDSTVAACDNKPAWYCSGVIMRSTDRTYPFTTPPGAVVGSYSYLRHDTNTSNFWSNKQGIIIRPTAQLETRLKCIYPYDADTHAEAGRNRGDYYCNSTAMPGFSTTDLSSCNSAGVINNGGTPSQWSNNFKNKNYAHATQCSFSVHDAKQFFAAILATRHHIDGQTWNELIMSPMPRPEDVPDIEAFWYIVTNTDRNQEGKNAALHYVSMYKSLRNITVPVVSFNPETNTFSLAQ